jgi:tight adherence protein C
MNYAAAALLGLSVAFAVFGLVELAPLRRRALLRRLAELREGPAATSAARARGTTFRRERIKQLLQRLGELRGSGVRESTRLKLARAGYREPQAAALYAGLRIALALAFGALAFALFPLLGVSARAALFLGLYFAVVGWLAPVWLLNQAIRGRQRVLQRSLPDALDLLVVCVEAGLGLNQAMMRVADQMKLMTAALGEELSIVTLEIHAGVPRADALRNFGERTDLSDARSLGALLIQADRFGTPIAQALRVHADSLRLMRRQRAEEAAAKTSIKLLFPLVLFIFPPLYLIILGPALITMASSLAGIR